MFIQTNSPYTHAPFVRFKGTSTPPDSRETNSTPQSLPNPGKRKHEDRTDTFEAPARPESPKKRFRYDETPQIKPALGSSVPILSELPSPALNEAGNPREDISELSLDNPFQTRSAEESIQTVFKPQAQRKGIKPVSQLLKLQNKLQQLQPDREAGEASQQPPREPS